MAHARRGRLLGTRAACAARAARAVRVMMMWGLAALALCGAACGGSTAIIVEVTRDESTQAGIDRLSFLVAAQDHPLNAAPLFVQDPRSSANATVTGRDLVKSPFRLFIGSALKDSGPIAVAVLAFAGTSADPVAFGFVDPPQQFIAGQELVVHVLLRPIDQTSVSTKSTGCLTWVDSNQQAFAIGTPDDKDCDGYSPPADCDDRNPDINPGASEICGNGIDDNCNGMVDEEVDLDNDGFTNCQGDCNDNDPAIHPGAPEVCDGKDNDCNGICDDPFDADHDNYTTCGTLILGDAGSGNEGKCMSPVTPDCNDNLAGVHPGATEVCNGRDDDCSGKCDDLASLDPDADGFTLCGTLASDPWGPVRGLCGARQTPLVDCAPGDMNQHPFAHELCDGKDDNCDGALETQETCFRQIGLPTIDAGPLLVDASVGPGDCVLGLRGCSETATGTFALAPSCGPGDNLAIFQIAVDDRLCNDYGGTCGSRLEPYLCAVTNQAVARYDCTLLYTHTSGNEANGTPDSFHLCSTGGGPATTPLPSIPGSAGAGCAWDLVGDVAQEQWQAGVAMTAIGPMAGELLSCTGSLLIAPSPRNGIAPQPDNFVFLYGDPNFPKREAVLFRIHPQRVATCTDPGLSCTGPNPP
jgi:putative metal-binding protein